MQVAGQPIPIVLVPRGHAVGASGAIGPAVVVCGGEVP